MHQWAGICRPQAVSAKVYNDSQERIVVYLRTALRKGKYYYKSK